MTHGAQCPWNSRPRRSGAERNAKGGVRSASTWEFTVRIGCWSCGGLSTTTHRPCEELQLDLLGQAETYLVISSLNRFFLTANVAVDYHYSGMVMYLSPRLSKSLMFSACIGSRILYARFRCKACQYLNSRYIPMKSRKSPGQIEVYKRLRKLIDMVPTRDSIICIGNFNSRLC